MSSSSLSDWLLPEVSVYILLGIMDMRVSFDRSKS